MGVKSLWQSLIAADLVEQWDGQIPAALPPLTAELDGKVLAVDLSMWIMQAGEQAALAPYCNQEEAAAKVAFERAIHWLRFGITPVFVIEGMAPAEKRDAQRSRLYDRLGGGHGTSNARINAFNNVAAPSRGTTQFIRSSQQVAAVLEAMGLPVIQAPGEAEATCAALCTAGVVDGVASFDGDTLLFGAEVVYPVVKLSATQEKNCSLTKCTLAAVRSHLGLTTPGSGRHALSLFAVLCGCDYDESGAQGVGGIGAMALVKNLLKGQNDDSNILYKFQNLLYSGPDPSLAALVKCTGCAQCKHESGKNGRIKLHTERNKCLCCPPARMNNVARSGSVLYHDYACIPRSGDCQCAFHRRANDRMAERVAAKARAEPDLAQRARDAVAVYFREAAEASAAVEQEMLFRNIIPGEKLAWLHRPNVKSVHQAITALHTCSTSVGVALDWDLSTLRSKMIPALIEWDLRHCPTVSSSPLQNYLSDDANRNITTNKKVEFAVNAIKKIQGSGIPGTQWRYLVEFTRVEDVDLEHFGNTSLRALTKNAASVAGAADILLSSQQDDYYNEDFLATQRPVEHAESIPVGVFDEQWLASDLGKTHRGVRMSIIKEKYPELEAAFLSKGSFRRISGAGNTVRKQKQHQQQKQHQEDITAPERSHIPTRILINNLAAPPARQNKQHQSDQCNLPSPGSIDKYLVQQRRGEADLEDNALVLNSSYQGHPAGANKKGERPGSGRGVIGQNAFAKEKEKNNNEKEEDRNEDELSPSPSKKQRNNTTPGINNAAHTIDPGSGSGTGYRRESDNLKSLKTLAQRRKARLAAENARLASMTKKERARIELTRQRGGAVNRLLASSGGGENIETTAAAAPAAAPTAEEEEEEKEEAEIIDLVSPVCSSSSEEELEIEEVEEEHQTGRQRRKASPPAERRRSWRQHWRRPPDQQEEVVIDLTGEASG